MAHCRREEPPVSTVTGNRQPHRSHRDGTAKSNKDGTKTAVTINYHA
jgi:hypothetical protein